MVYFGEGICIYSRHATHVVPYECVYNCILEIPLFTSLNIFASIIHLNMNYHNIYDEHIIIHVNLAKSQMVHEMMLKDPTTIVFLHERMVKKASISNQGRLNINITDFDAH